MFELKRTWRLKHISGEKDAVPIVKLEKAKDQDYALKVYSTEKETAEAVLRQAQIMK